MVCRTPCIGCHLAECRRFRRSATSHREAPDLRSWSCPRRKLPQKQRPFHCGWHSLRATGILLPAQALGCAECERERQSKRGYGTGGFCHSSNEGRTLRQTPRARGATRLNPRTRDDRHPPQPPPVLLIQRRHRIPPLSPKSQTPRTAFPTFL